MLDARDTIRLDLPPSKCPDTAVTESVATSTQLQLDPCRRVRVWRYVLREMSQILRERSADPEMTLLSELPPKRRTHVILCW